MTLSSNPFIFLICVLVAINYLYCISTLILVKSHKVTVDSLFALY